MSPPLSTGQRLQRLFLTGLLTLLPLWLTWVVVKFVFVLLSGIGRPLVEPVLNGLAAGALALAWLARTPYALLPLLLVPVLFVALVAWGFARTLRGGRVPLVTKIATALETGGAAQLEPEVARYTRGLTRLWAIVLFALAAINLVLALLAVPRGLLATFGIATPWPVGETLWSWCANAATYGLIGGLMVAEFAWRSRRFPGRYHGPLDFVRRMAALGPGFWNGLFR